MEAEAAENAPARVETSESGALADGDSRLNQQAVVTEDSAEEAMALRNLIGACAEDPEMSVTAAMTSTSDG